MAEKVYTYITRSYANVSHALLASSTRICLSGGSVSTILLGFPLSQRFKPNSLELAHDVPPICLAVFVKTCGYYTKCRRVGKLVVTREILETYCTRYIIDEILHHDLKIPTIRQHIVSSSIQYSHKLGSHPSALVTQLMKNERTKRRLERRIPQDLAKLN
jgi:hypothetical protein